MPLKRVVDGVELVAVLAVVVVVVMLFANTGGSEATACTPARGGAQSRGEKIFEANCASCHGASGEGAIGPKLACVVETNYPNIDDQIAVVTDGRSSMPAFGGELSTSQIRAVVEYTRTALGR